MNIVDAITSSFDDSTFKREVSFFATEDGIISSTTSFSGGAVEFDFFSIWDFLKSKKERTKEFYMIHSHPMGMNKMSSIDWNMVHGWCIALGEPIWFIIVTDTEIVFYLCEYNKETLLASRNLVATYNYFTDYGIKEYTTMAHIAYGFSKQENISDEDLKEAIKVINQSSLRLCNPQKYLV